MTVQLSQQHLLKRSFSLLAACSFEVQTSVDLFAASFWPSSVPFHCNICLSILADTWLPFILLCGSCIINLSWVVCQSSNFILIFTAVLSLLGLLPAHKFLFDFKNTCLAASGLVVAQGLRWDRWRVSRGLQAVATSHGDSSSPIRDDPAFPALGGDRTTGTPRSSHTNFRLSHLNRCGLIAHFFFSRFFFFFWRDHLNLF